MTTEHLDPDTDRLLLLDRLAERLRELDLDENHVDWMPLDDAHRRIADPNYPSVIQNYPNQFPDGRPVKSTSIGIKNAEGRYVAALYMNLDVSTLSPMTLSLANLVAVMQAGLSRGKSG